MCGWWNVEVENMLVNPPQEPLPQEPLPQEEWIQVQEEWTQEIQEWLLYGMAR